MNIFYKVLVVVSVAFVVFNIFLVGRFYMGKNSIAAHNRVMAQHKIELAPVEHLTVLPVVDLFADTPNFKTEPGTSYLLETDNGNILFDVGYNIKKEEISPLLQNLNELRISLKDIDALAISHNHADHVGGFCYREKRVELTNGAVDLSGKKIYTPVPLTCDTAEAVTVEQPSLITKDIASTGPLVEQMFIPGKLFEQSLLINLKDKGLVLVSGCGHPGIVTMIEKAQEITGLPVYAVVGGLHLYYTQPKSGIWGNIFGSNKMYCRTLSQEEVADTVDKLIELGVQKAYISPHDADQPTLEIFAHKFGSDFETLKVGQPITF